MVSVLLALGCHGSQAEHSGPVDGGGVTSDTGVLTTTGRDTSTSAHTGATHSAAVAATAETAGRYTGGGHTSETGATGSDTGSVSVETSQDTGLVLPPGTLAACDLTLPSLPMSVPVTATVLDVRSGAVLGVQNVDFQFGDRVYVAAGLSSRQLVVGQGAAAFFFSLPLQGSVVSTDAASVTDAHALGFAVGDLLGDRSEEVVLGQAPYPDLFLATPPLPAGYTPVSSVASGSADSTAVPDMRDVDVGDWDGDGQEDFLFSWDGGGRFGGVRYPPQPYPLGGSAVYLGPLSPAPLSLLSTDPPAAWIDIMALDSPNGGSLHIGEHSRLIPDVDGDGRAEILAAFQGGPNAVPRYPPVYGSYDSGGFALFPGGQAGANVLGTERNLLVATCNSDALDWVCGQFAIATEVEEVGDQDGDGFEDLVVRSDFVEVRGGCRHVDFLVTRLPYVTGAATYTQASSAIIFSERGNREAASIGDLNHDGLPELALSATFPEPVGSVFVFLSPVQGTLDILAADLEITGGPTSGAEFGNDLLSADLDGDGVPDLAIGDISDNGFTGAVHIVSGAALQQVLGL